ncbi:hypothetical protein FOE78_08825 [Microlunatus elymi]|uniref:Uncharacterized protein n=1 Tax=Microlunatus elymi TaxID=2596828 RepID=A0A516PXT5_9ACTN|nr:hypothetical protein [Microlunatus elymi]QDP95987.1 hypothetical protein FOE78_08825 [Microlunatus elymi]
MVRATGLSEVEQRYAEVLARGAVTRSDSGRGSPKPRPTFDLGDLMGRLVRLEVVDPAGRTLAWIAVSSFAWNHFGVPDAAEALRYR